MKISFNWLQELVRIRLSPRELAERLTMAGVEVEGVEAIRPAFEKVVVGRIEAIRPSPQAEGMPLCQVNVGKLVLPILCGARNISAGDLVPVALPGALLPGGRRIEEAMIRGERSVGMLCSEKELGLGEDGSGILILDGDLRPGLDLTQALKLEDHLLEVAVTPNRGDCLSHWGIAREVAALTGAPLRLKVARPREAGRSIREITSVTVEAPDLCPRYAARVIQGVKIGPSPFWLRRRLELCGLRAVSNVVDATNYVLLEMGQPLHAFDHARLRERRIVVRRARAGERIVTLDGAERTLHPDMLVIADAADPVAIAGVMGGSATEVGSTTTDLLLESALFQSVSIRRTAKTLGLSTEASYRFERGVDPGGIALALDRVARLILGLAGGKIAKGIIDIRRKVPRPSRLLLRVERVREILGTPVPREEIRQILHRLQCRVRQRGAKAIEALVPSHRLDLSREIDLIEEVARLRGFEQIPTTLPVSQIQPAKEAPLLEIEREIRQLLTASGFQEAINFSFTDERLFDTLRLPEGHSLRRLVRLRNPLGGETVLRSFLLPSLLQNVALNESRGVKSLRLFEISRIYRPQEEGMLPPEARVAGMVATGERGPIHWGGPQETVDFYDLKGVLEALEIHCGISLRLERRESIPYLHPGRQAEIFLGEELVGWIGEIHPEVIKGYDLAGRPVALEIDLDLLGKYRRPTPIYASFPRYPAVLRDVAVIVPEKMPAAEVEAVIRRAGGALAEAVRLFDVYQGEPVPPGKRSLAFSIQYRSPDRTLTDEEVEAIHGTVLQILARDLGAAIR